MSSPEFVEQRVAEAVAPRQALCSCKTPSSANDATQVVGCRATPSTLRPYVVLPRAGPAHGVIAAWKLWTTSRCRPYHAAVGHPRTISRNGIAGPTHSPRRCRRARGNVRFLECFIKASACGLHRPVPDEAHRERRRAERARRYPVLRQATSSGRPIRLANLAQKRLRVRGMRIHCRSAVLTHSTGPPLRFRRPWVA